MASNRSASSGCFSGIVRRLLCNGSPQTHPSDHIAEPNITKYDRSKKEIIKTEAKVEAPDSTNATPGVVARLMGLDSLPVANWVPRPSLADSVTRSRSVNFIEYLLQSDLTQGHRRVRTSVSFREVPTSLNQQNCDPFVAYFENEDDTMGMKLKLRKSEMGLGELKQKRPDRTNNKDKNREIVVSKKETQGKKKKISKFKDEPRRVLHKHNSKVSKCNVAKVSSFVTPRKVDVNRKYGATSKAKSRVLKPLNKKEVSLEVKSSVRKSKPENMPLEPTECSTENSSPVSVLDVNDFDIYDATPLSEDTKYTETKSSTKPTKFDDNPTPHFNGIFKSEDRVEIIAINKKDKESVDNAETQYYKELVAKLHRLTEEDIKQTNAKQEFKFDDFEAICFEFGQQILDIMLEQVVDELVEFHMHGKF
ncbi:VARLMGL domain-containing protein [Cephalotus follicularis]|uniref:VARLMGL domain-containing protein n=1 Tax=Cephalotus follicularis TaxID=3775 RepID=A0A1Q3D479_CEPFO|nr:VARLMGL domain-containing protein [Cephalotus follicularis]